MHFGPLEIGKQLPPSRQQVVPALVAHPKGGFVKGHRLDCVAVAVVPLGGRAVLHAVVAVPYVLKEVHLPEAEHSVTD